VRVRGVGLISATFAGVVVGAIASTITLAIMHVNYALSNSLGTDNILRNMVNSSTRIFLISIISGIGFLLFAIVYNVFAKILPIRISIELKNEAEHSASKPN